MKFEMAPETVGEISTKDGAVKLHQLIQYNYSMAASSLVEAAKGLKLMRDDKAYKFLGMETFEEYTTQMLGIKPRQAYTYISALERLGLDMMQAQAPIGITKLSLLAEITPADREEFAEENDLAGMTVQQVRELVDEVNNKGQQISLFEEKAEESSAIMDKQAGQIKELLAEIEVLKSRPAKVETVVLQEPSEDQMQELREKIRAEESAARESAVAAAVAEAEKAGKEKLKAEKEKRKEAAAEAEAVKGQLEALKKEAEAERAAAEERAEELRKENALTADADMVAASVMLDAVQGDLARLIGKAGDIAQGNPEKGRRLSRALIRYLEEDVLPAFREIVEGEEA